MVTKNEFISFFGEFKNEHFIQQTDIFKGLYLTRNTKEETLQLVDVDNKQCFYNFDKDDNFNEKMEYVFKSADSLLNGYLGTKKQRKEHQTLVKSINKITSLCNVIEIMNVMEEDLKGVECSTETNLVKF